jgi:hypothetical protein
MFATNKRQRETLLLPVLLFARIAEMSYGERPVWPGCAEGRAPGTGRSRCVHSREAGACAALLSSRGGRHRAPFVNEPSASPGAQGPHKPGLCCAVVLPPAGCTMRCPLARLAVLRGQHL